ncbi:MAG: TlyA family RNA methyltransferase [Epsilonproteobacteria bacterium]|nr:TlyA family RNA methyltransferase [Campylobacterota bacterium]
MRLDNFLFKNGHAKSRNKAQELIKNLQVLIDGKIVSKPSSEIDESNKLEILNPKQYVSRAGYKLKSFLKTQEIFSIKDKHCLDIGSSTGGFVQVLLEEGAREVVAVDVGSGQLHEDLKNISNLRFFEQTDIRNFKCEENFDIVTCDVSFIGVGQILKEIDRFAKEYIVILFKPQFEVGVNAKRDKKGVVKDNFAIKKAKELFEAKAQQKWELLCTKESLLRGKEGNIETFYCFRKR